MLDFFKTVLDHAFLLPLMELELNQCTSNQGGQILSHQGLARPSCFSSEAPLFFGKSFISLELTSTGENEFRQIFHELPHGHYSGHFGNALSAYSCIDEGSGICATQKFIEDAVNMPNLQILERLVDAETGAKHFLPIDLIDSFRAQNSENCLSGRLGQTRAIVDLPSKRRL
ncbi:hypothetical protein [Phaeovulum sp.]|uniref:hypothetical protein n=1 Tax=Phaeovulum sp. TaxID=2934796 RepID=UPI0039E4FD91